MDEFNLDEWLSEESNGSTDLVAKESQTLSTSEVRLLNYCEQVYWESGLLPTAESASESLGIRVQACRKAFQNETFKTQLASRGMDPEQLVFPGKLIKESKALSAKQIVCANMMLNLHDKRSEREKLALIQVSSQQYHAWLRQPAFVEFLRKRGEALFSSSDFAAYKALVNNVKAGDNKSLELFFRMRGIYTPSVDVNINVEVLLQQVIEIVSKHVDSRTMNLIATEIEAVVEAESA
jgi:hypothetical protein